MIDIDWSKAPAHATHWCPGNARIEEGWIHQSGGEFYSCYNLRELEHIPDFPSWRKSRLVQRPVPWSGEGLPPVGTVCEHNANLLGWVKVEITARAKLGLCFMRPSYGRDGFVEDYISNEHAATRLRPIRTAEQIAADQRLHEVRNALTCISQKLEGFNLTIDCGAAIAATVGAMIDEGYRKQAAP